LKYFIFGLEVLLFQHYWVNIKIFVKICKKTIDIQLKTCIIYVGGKNYGYYRNGIVHIIYWTDCIFFIKKGAEIMDERDAIADRQWEALVDQMADNEREVEE